MYESAGNAQSAYGVLRIFEQLRLRDGHRGELLFFDLSRGEASSAV
jgi:hypothetical protein